MSAPIAAVLLAASVFAAPAPATPAAAPASGGGPRSTRIPPPGAKPVRIAVSTVAASEGIGVSTYTISTLYTGDRVRDPFQATSLGGAPVRRREESAPIDVHGLQLRGIMKDVSGDFALFTADDGQTLMLKRGKLYDGRNKVVRGITGQIFLKQKQAKLMTADRDEQYYSLEEINDDDAEPAKP